MNLIKLVSLVQYQAAKLEVVEDLCRQSTDVQATLETQVAYNMVSTLRQKLFEDAESCLDSLIESRSQDQIKSSIYSLRSTIVSANNFLLQMSSAINTSDAIWLKILFTDIVAKLMSFNSELESGFLLLSDYIDNDSNCNETLSMLEINIQSQISTNYDSVSTDSDNLFRKLVSRCMGNYDQAQRLIEYELNKSQGINQDEAISRALSRWERDNL